MARIRTIKPEFWTSEQITECSPNARLLFIGLWTFADDNGIHPASIKRVKMEVFPSDDFGKAQVAKMVDELKAQGLLTEYEAQGLSYWRITGWHHQKIDQPTYKHPLPDGTLPANVRRSKFAESGSPNQDQRTFDERSPPEGKGRDKEQDQNQEQQQRALVVQAEKPPKPDTARGSRLPTGWELPDDWKTWAELECPVLNVPRESLKFRDYWHGKPGAAGRKVDWQATWRNWIRNTTSRGPGPSGSPPPLSKTAQAFLTLEGMKSGNKPELARGRDPQGPAKALGLFAGPDPSE
jgi:hypothetical protein